jgi:poly(A) polymerase/tRNA nucleotidyltransferase (CCA-adding enzyme)
LAALFHDLGKAKTLSFTPEGEPRFLGHEKISVELVNVIMQRLKFPNATINEVMHLIRYHMFDYQEEWTDAAVRRFIARVGAEHMDKLFALRLADASGHCNKPVNSIQLLKLQERIETVKKQAGAFSLKDLCIDGNILMKQLSLPPGPLVGKILSFLLESVLEDPALNTRDKLLHLARHYYEERMLPLINPHADYEDKKV